EAEQPVERGVAAADDDARPVAEDGLLAYEVVEASALPVVDALDAELARLEGAVPGGHDQRAAEIRLGGARPDGEELLSVLRDVLQLLHLFAEVHLRAPLEPLLGAELDEIAPEDLRVPRDVVDVLLRVDGRDLAAELLDRVDDPNRCVAVAGVVGGGETGRPRAENRDVDDVVRAHSGRNGSRPSADARHTRGCTPSDQEEDLWRTYSR